MTTCLEDKLHTAPCYAEQRNPSVGSWIGALNSRPTHRPRQTSSCLVRRAPIWTTLKWVVLIYLSWCLLEIANRSKLEAGLANLEGRTCCITRD